jgi:hypothetical protein
MVPKSFSSSRRSRSRIATASVAAPAAVSVRPSSWRVSSALMFADLGVLAEPFALEAGQTLQDFLRKVGAGSAA